MFDRAKKLFLDVFPERKIDFLELIPRGYSNKTFRVVSGGESFRVRVGCNNDIIDRENERLILEAVGNGDCLFYDGVSGDGIWRWIEGCPVTKGHLSLSFLVDLCREIEGIHSIPMEKLKGVLDHDDLEFFGDGRCILDGEISDLYLRLVNKYRGDERRLCHNDISLSNLIYDQSKNKIHLIDYEWGRINSPYWDYGNFVKEGDLDIDYARYLAIIARLDPNKLFEYCFMASVYSLQLSYSFPESESLNDYRRRVGDLIIKYRGWLGGW